MGGSIKYFRPPPLKLKIINCKVFKHYSITFNNIWGGLKTETGNNILGGSKTETGNFGGGGLKTESGNSETGNNILGGDLKT